MEHLEGLLSSVYSEVGNVCDDILSEYARKDAEYKALTERRIELSGLLRDVLDGAGGIVLDARRHALLAEYLQIINVIHAINMRRLYIAGMRDKTVMTSLLEYL